MLLSKRQSSRKRYENKGEKKTMNDLRSTEGDGQSQMCDRKYKINPKRIRLKILRDDRRFVPVEIYGS